MLAGKSARDEREAARRERLQELGEVSGESQRELDALASRVAEQLATPVALISLARGERHHFQARHGLGTRAIARAKGLCDYVVTLGTPLFLEDVREDPRFARCPLVLDEPHARFYAGVPLQTHDGLVLGALSAIDRVPRGLGAAEERLLWACAGQTVELLVREQPARQVLVPQVSGVPDAATSGSTSLVAERMPRTRVLIVDDELAVARALSRVLMREHEVSIELDARRVRPRIEAGEQFDALVCDLMMPHLTGAQLHRELSALDPRWAARFLFVTGGATDPAVDAFLERVDNVCLPKPIPMQALRDAVQTLTRRAQHAR